MARQQFRVPGTMPTPPSLSLPRKRGEDHCGEAVAGAGAAPAAPGRPPFGPNRAYDGRMTAYVALLRAVNVGGRGVKMAALRDLFADLGFAGARTHLQSGNVIFTAHGERAQIAATIEAGIVDRFGFHSETMLRSAAELQRLTGRNPFPEMAAADPSHLVVMFLAGLPTAEDRAALRMEWDGPETWAAVGADLFICYPKGIGRSKLKLKLKTSGTGRNWTVVQALAALAAEAANGSKPAEAANGSKPAEAAD